MTAKIQTTKIDAAAIVPFLQRREKGFWGKVAVMMGLGVPLSLVGPVMLGMVFWVVSLLVWRWYPWSWYFWGAMVVVLPLLYRMEMRGGYDLSNAVKGDSPNVSAGLWALSHIRGPAGEIFAVAAIAAAPRATAAGFVEIFLAGPRMVVSAVRQWRAVKAMRGVDVGLAGEMVARLLSAGKSMPVKELPGGGKMEAVGPALAYLVFFEWIGLSGDGEKVWMLTEAKATLGIENRK